MTADGSLFETTGIPGHLAPTPQRLERLLSKQPLEELYEVEDQPFARGKYAAVKRCRERASGRQWAAKFLKKRRRAQELRAEALHEVAVLDAAARCSRLVSLHQVFETKTEMVLVLELAPGGELQMVLDKDEVPEERQVARLMKQILDGIAFLHSLNVAHLDIKPQNLVLTGEFPDCDVKLCDFGISRYINHGADIREILGTPDYVAPEVLNYEPISLATDMWSVGVLLYVLLTGCSPFGGDSKQETFCNISRCRLDFPDDLFEDVSEEARDLMRKLMVKDPSERLTVTECLQHPWFSAHDGPETPLALTPTSTQTTTLTTTTTSSSSSSNEEERPSSPGDATTKTKQESSNGNASSIESSRILNQERKMNAEIKLSPNGSTTIGESKPTTATSVAPRAAVSSHTENVYSKSKSTSNVPMPVRIGLSPDRRDTFKKNMDSLAQRFSTSTEIVIIEPSAPQRRATATHTMPAGEIFKCTPVFILGEEQHCDSGSDTVSEISTDSSSDRSSIYSDDSLDFILYGKTQSRASFPFVGADTERWEQKHPRIWPRECSGVVSKALSRFSSEPGTGGTGKPVRAQPGPTTRGRASLEAMRERGGELVVIREPVRAGRYTRYSEVQCESVQARIRRFQVQGAS